jgi:putative inorganic carbon (HCO3(-)) transporter
VRADGEQVARVPEWPWERLPYGRWIGRLGLGALVLAWGWVLAHWPLTMAGLVLAGAVVGVAVLVWPALALPLLAVAVPFGSLRTVSIGPAQVGGEEMLLALAVAAWLARQLARRTLHLTWPSFAGAGLLLLAAMLASFLPASSLTLAAKEMLKWVELWLAALLVLNMVGTGGALLLALGLLAAGAAQGLLGVYQFLARSGPPGFLLMERFMRAAGTFDQPNPYGGYLGLTLPLAVGLVLAVWPTRGAGAPGSRQAGDGLPGGERLAVGVWLAAAAAAVLMAGGLFASWSRGAWLGAAAGVAAVVVARGGRWLRGIVAVGVVGVLLCFALLGRLPLPGALTERFTGLASELTTLNVRDVEVDDANFAVVERVAHWQAAWGMFSDHPWTGVGLGNYVEAYERYALPRWPDPLGHAHNYCLNIAAEAGLPGLGAYLLWMAAGLWLAVRAVRRSHGLWQGLALGVLGMWVHLNVHNLFDNLYVHGMGIQIGLMLGLAAWIVARSENRLGHAGLGA